MTLVIDQVMPYREKALDWVRRRLGNRDFEADDILQNVLLRMLQQKPLHLRNPEKYLLRACANAVKEHFRKSIRRNAKSNRYRVEPRSPMIEYDLHELCDDRCLKGLTADQLRVAWLVALGFSLVEAALYLGISAVAARARMHAARKRREWRAA